MTRTSRKHEGPKNMGGNGSSASKAPGLRARGVARRPRRSCGHPPHACGRLSRAGGAPAPHRCPASICRFTLDGHFAAYGHVAAPFSRTLCGHSLLAIPGGTSCWHSWRPAADAGRGAAISGGEEMLPPVKATCCRRCRELGRPMRRFRGPIAWPTHPRAGKEPLRCGNYATCESTDSDSIGQYAAHHKVRGHLCLIATSVPSSRASV
jgi:hypothetical protein